ncbi:Equilibrative Nucleoside Transporter (ENT) Family [Thraustotheca clavata]|uniref:Equilibrative Nucleoside Transporter (ENT) Family n=1 Tax=Thraustotheca clavata TaxID=74557 RepID=A0A1W0A374_9STRA|nr:Equilibrative Nucleoside Transporter (ENT) Family [Thraustotheca clavata]
MDTPVEEGKNAKLIINDAEGDIPQHITDNIQENRRFIWWALLFLNGSCLWAYYSCLSAQSYYTSRFKTTSFNFAYLTTPVTTWPMFVGQFIQVMLGLDKKMGMWNRVRIGFAIYACCALAIILQDAANAEPQTGATIVLVAFAVIGATNALTEAGFYAMSALFPEAAFTNAIQMGNGASGVINITLNTLIKLCVGGPNPKPEDDGDIEKIAFYIFFSVFILVCFLAVFLFWKLMQVPGVKYLMERNQAETVRRAENKETMMQHWSRLGRIFAVIVLPVACQFIIFLCSLTAFPGISITAGFQLAGVYKANWGTWYVNGVLLCYNYGDFTGRVISQWLYRFFTLRSCFIWTLLRWVLFIFVLIGLPGNGQNSLFAMENAHDFNIFWLLFINFTLGITTGVLSTITFGLGPRLVPQEDRESAGAIMCLGLFLGISSGATIGSQFGEKHWLAEEDIPQHVLDNIQENRRFIWWTLLFLNGSCLWAYYSCLSAQSYYTSRFASTSFNFAYLTTPVTTWPMFVAQFIQVVFGLDKKMGMWNRVRIGFTIYACCALAIILQNAANAEPQTGATIVLIAFAVIGATNALTEAGFYAMSALFPEASFTNAIQMGNGTSGVINITLNTLIQLIVGGINPSTEDTNNIQKVSFYIFFSVFILVCFLAVFLFWKLRQIPAVQYLMERNEAETVRRAANKETISQHWGRLGRIFAIIILPVACQFIIFLCSLTAFPGISITAGFQLAGVYKATWGSWYINGVLLCYNYGDFIGRVISPWLYRFFTLRSCFIWTLSRWVLFIFLLIGLPGGGQNSLFSMQNTHDFNIFWMLFINFVIGLTNGVLSTITFGLGPRLVQQEDRESAGAIMCLGLFLGISSGATIGWQFGDKHWLGA